MTNKLFIPFQETQAGNVATWLFDVTTIDANTGKAKTKGFSENYRVFAPPKVDGKYQPTGSLSNLTGADSQLYVCGHCLSGQAYLTTEAYLGPGGTKVEIPEIIDQLDAHGFPEGTQAKVKLFGCQTGLDRSDSLCFGKRFSVAVHKKWKSCRIFAYGWFVLVNYMPQEGGAKQLIPDKNSPPFHKWVKPMPADFFPQVIAAIKAGKPLANERMARVIQKRWEKLLQEEGNDQNRARDRIINGSDYNLFFGNMSEAIPNVPGNRARSQRLEFQNGILKSTTIEDGVDG